MAFVVELPALFLLFIAVMLALALACGGQRYIHRRFPEEDFVRRNEAGGVIISIAGTLYAVLFELQYPFRAGLRVPADDWTAVIRQIRTMQSGTQPEMRM
jgi:hypothetical protein